MAALYVIIFILCGLCICVKNELNLSEESPCITEGLNGTCLGVFKCTSAALTYLLRNAGFRTMVGHSIPTIPDFPDICSYKNNVPVVCCTDCERDDDEYYRNFGVAPLALLWSKEGSIAWSKCLENFQNLPYRCRGLGNISIKKIWYDEKKCYNTTLAIALAVGGRDAQRWEFPHVALLGYGEEAESAQWLCGGSVISERYILTAAHCTSTRALGNITFAALGLLKRTDPKKYWKIYKIKRIITHPEYEAPSKYHDIALLETENEGNITFAALGLLKRTDPKKYWKIYKIKRIITHPEYEAPSKYHDIALLETENEINFGRDLLPACLYTGNGYTSDVEGSGWGRLGHRKSLSDTLQVVYLEEYNETECSAIYQPHRHLKDGYDHEKQMCYGSHKEIVDTCEGDSGGPLQINTDKCLYTIVAVTSYGKDCGIRGSAGMYTRVSYYVPWIESVVWPEETEARKQKDNEWLNKWLGGL